MLQSFFCPTRIHFGAGAHEKLAELVGTLNCTRIFVTADPAMRSSAILARILAILDQAGIAHSVFSDIEPDPSDTTVAKAFEQCRAHGATAILALGGGSTIDVGKGAGILMTNGGRINDYEGIEVFRTPPLPLIAIPTTAGTGSEVSGSCTITDTTRNLKMSIRHASLNPARIAILDPVALRTLPEHVAVHSGIDAFVHAFESYVSKGANPFTDALNLRAMTLLAGSIRAFAADRTNEQAGLDMLMGSAMAGMCFGQTGLGNVHCIARFLGAYFHLSHGLSNALCLPAVAEFNRPAAIARYARVAPLLGVTDDLPEEEASRATVAAIAQLCRDLGVPPRLRDAGAREEVYEEMADLCVAAGYDRWNPRPTTREDFLALLRQAH
ncbi:iron-containing alcohol dehydrogenase [Roseomonas terrae]|jgi:alcohol dehydrogenase|uniref:Iron-containing alcohol dehydrogenase n=1 Tax=Neoroseomonas terrae TaxID=424799 RepID=A0ABS5EBE7_9PROT|nr:iron-containing alcohol dehydrogenase [Neoroseomonas terrae]MBR0648345.1 iron-containing alcohol dehydrogenase [Neoroseomonas terrae]